MALEGMDLLSQDLPPADENEEELVEELEEDAETDSEDADEDTDTETAEESPEDDIEASTALRPSFKEITTKFPDLIKTFPAIKDMYFRESKYTEIFPTVGEAESAKNDLQGLAELESGLMSGRVEDVESTLTSMKALGDDVIPNFAVNFLPALYKTDKDAYFGITTTVLLNGVRTMYNQGVASRDEELSQAAQLMAAKLFGDPEIATGKKQIDLPKAKLKDATNGKLSEVEVERQKFETERYEATYQDIVTNYVTDIKSAILDGLDNDEVMSDFMKNAVVNKILSDINKVTLDDKGYQSQMKQLWEKAKNASYTREWKDRITSTVLSRAKSIMPAIRSKARAEALGMKQRQSSKLLGGKTKKRLAPTDSNTGSGRIVKVSRVDTKNIDWRKTSDFDIMNGLAKTK